MKKQHTKSWGETKKTEYRDGQGTVCDARKENELFSVIVYSPRVKVGTKYT